MASERVTDSKHERAVARWVCTVTEQRAQPRRWPPWLSRGRMDRFRKGRHDALKRREAARAGQAAVGRARAAVAEAGGGGQAGGGAGRGRVWAGGQAAGGQSGRVARRNTHSQQVFQSLPKANGAQPRGRATSSGSRRPSRHPPLGHDRHGQPQHLRRAGGRVGAVRGEDHPVAPDGGGERIAAAHLAAEALGL